MATPLQLPIPPTKDCSKQEAAQRRQILAQYYWPLHFQKGPVDPASFLDRVMTDYAYYDQSMVLQWTENPSPVYTLYKACLAYAIQHGRKEGEAYQQVLTSSKSRKTLDQYPRLTGCTIGQKSSSSDESSRRKGGLILD